MSYFVVMLIIYFYLQIIFGTSADIATDSVEVFKKFFILAQEFQKAADAAGGFEKLKQDPKFKEITPQMMDALYGAGKALEALPNPDIAARGLWSSAKGALEKGEKAWKGAKSVWNSIVDLEGATTVKP